ncbi:hypothetical protein AAVH_43586 [Aphelenchoides avenae]|nr:hypothetical protein AAVH_43586 [Aphelenchus avenae]
MSTVDASDSSSTEVILGHRLGDRDSQSHSDDALVKRTAISTRDDNRSSVSYQIGRTKLPGGKTVTIEKIPKTNATYRWLRRIPVFVVISVIQVR